MSSLVCMTEHGRIESPFSSFGLEDQREAFGRDETAAENRRIRMTAAVALVKRL
jgi:hypothetical protein